MNISHCDAEPIRIPGSIQPHGFLFVIDPDDLTVRQASQNVGAILGRAAEACIGQPVGKVLGEKAADVIRERASDIPTRSRPLFLGCISANDCSYHALAHFIDDALVLECEVAESNTPLVVAHDTIDTFTLQAENLGSLDTLAQVLCSTVRELTGFDRVLLYRFDATWNGQVIGEDGSDRLPYLFDHWFPASDIPAQARELYRVNRVRIIPDAAYVPVPLVAHNPTDADSPLDMSFSTLRSVSPVHT